MEIIKKKEYMIPELKECSLNMEDILVLSIDNTHDIFDFSDEL